MMMKIQLIFKIAKFTNSYTLKLGDRSYNLDKLEYWEDENYLYFQLCYLIKNNLIIVINIISQKTWIMSECSVIS